MRSKAAASAPSTIAICRTDRPPVHGCFCLPRDAQRSGRHSARARALVVTLVVIAADSALPCDHSASSLATRSTGAPLVCTHGHHRDRAPQGKRDVVARAELALPFVIDAADELAAPLNKSRPSPNVGEIVWLLQSRASELASCVSRALDRKLDVDDTELAITVDALTRLSVEISPPDAPLESCIGGALAAAEHLVPAAPVRYLNHFELLLPAIGPRRQVPSFDPRRGREPPDICVPSDLVVELAVAARPVVVDLRPDSVTMTQGRPFLMCGGGGADLSGLQTGPADYDRCRALSGASAGALLVKLTADAAGTVRTVELLETTLAHGVAACAMDELKDRRLPPRENGRALEVTELKLRLP